MSDDTDISDLPSPDTDISDLPAPDNPSTWGSAVKGVGQAGLALGSGALRSVASAANDILPETGFLGGPGARAEVENKIANMPALNYRGGPEARPILDALGTVTAPIAKVGHAIHQGISDVAGERAADVVGDVATLAPGLRGVTSRIGPATADSLVADAKAGSRASMSNALDAVRDEVGPDVNSVQPVEHGDTLISAYQNKAKIADANISAKYQALRDAAGGNFPVSAPGLLRNVTGKLNDELLLDHAPKAVMSTLGKLADDDKMTFQNFESLRTNLARIMRTSSDGNERAAAGVIRNAMEELPLAPGAAKLKPLADEARAAARAQFQALDADPAYKAAVNETVSPDRFVQKFITGPSATRDGVTQMKANLADNPVATQTMGVAALDHLRGVSGVDTGDFRLTPFRKQLGALGPRLDALLDPKNLGHLQTLSEAPETGAVKKLAAGALPFIGATVGGYAAGGPGAAGGEYIGERAAKKLLGQ